MKLLKKCMMGLLMAVILLASVAGMAGGDTAGWASVGVATAGALLGLWLTFCYGSGTIAWIGTPYWPGWPNIDAAQLVAEYLVLNEMKNVEDNWDPEPEEEYEQAAQNNGPGSKEEPEIEPTYDSAIQKLPFLAASLQNVGIEAIGIGSDLSDLTDDGTRKKILSDLAGIQEKEGATTSGKKERNPGAGSCAASYSVCLREMTTEQELAISATQKLNEQNFGTAGIAHAELGLKSVQQAMANDGNSATGSSGSGISSDQAASSVSVGTAIKAQDLSGLVGKGANTVVAMKIVALMNLELAQRLNQGNMMQGSALTIEAARAFSQTTGKME